MRFPLRLVTDRKQNNARELRVPAHGDPWRCEGEVLRRPPLRTWCLLLECSAAVWGSFRAPVGEQGAMAAAMLPLFRNRVVREGSSRLSHPVGTRCSSQTGYYVRHCNFQSVNAQALPSPGTPGQGGSCWLSALWVTLP